MEKLTIEYLTRGARQPDAIATQCGKISSGAAAGLVFLALLPIILPTTIPNDLDSAFTVAVVLDVMAGLGFAITSLIRDRKNGWGWTGLCLNLAMYAIIGFLVLVAISIWRQMPQGH